MAASTANVEGITGLLNECLSKVGFEVYPLKVGWYNSVLPPTLRLAYPDNSLAVVLLSTPAMFEQAFLPFMEEKGCQVMSDPIDQCVKHSVSSAVSQCFPGQEVDVRYDYEMLPSRKPKFLAQTAAHVSGAAFYYQQSDVRDQPWAEKKMFGVCVHPRFGGWFAIRALLVFGGVTIDSEMVQPLPPDCVPSRESKIELLEAFNFHWQDWSYRDIVRPVQIYSQKQKDYFSTLPAERFALLQTWGFLPRESDQPDLTSDAQSQVAGHG
ncbi:cyanocobalamin reductase / alkylcobalamin dealkylase isoform X1 [Cottoperca gobio]|uniref:Cyanocobalamin reductase / alkylcobalamin dealkylase n=1 Tax=Cottoperca gobio TaxID=56716 RepID=A0A6J2PIB0_COTGO|nr:methylmalonic aciduria and homocystinuria type C protein isoform X1 [Cottoperca gobio]XP_029285032.1 methylmalonic aciduria and homocystinuria type C protein isoform X1 [Cottoperca gobio]